MEFDKKLFTMSDVVIPIAEEMAVENESDDVIFNGKYSVNAKIVERSTGKGTKTKISIE